MISVKRFIIIDGNGILHRAYHALPPLTNKQGVVVNAVYGFCSMLFKVISDLKPDYMAVAFDRAAPTFRQELYVGYQAQRPKMADDLSPQIAMVHEVLEAMRIAIFEIDGYEADDLIGTIARQAIEKTIEDGRLKIGVENRRSKVEKKKINPLSSNIKKLPSTFYHPPSSLEVIIVSGDRDMLQLVNAHVRVYAPIIGLSKTMLFDRKTVEGKYGIKPAQIIDYKALTGDTSDNYPGVAGIGPKTASELLRQYTTLENLYQNIEKLSPKIGEKLATDIEQASLAKKLATIALDCPISLDIEKCSSKHFDTAGAKQVFEAFGFKSLLKRLPGYVEEPRAKGLQREKKGRKGNGQLGLL